MSLIACNKCGKEYSNLALKCPVCGHETKSPDVKWEKSKKAKIFKYTIIGLIASALLVVGGIQGYSYYNYTKGNAAMKQGEFDTAIHYYENIIWDGGKGINKKIAKCNMGKVYELKVAKAREDVAEMERYLALSEDERKKEITGEIDWMGMEILYGGGSDAKWRLKVYLDKLEEIKNSN